MNAKRNTMGAITAIKHQNSMVEMALLYHDVIITSVRTVDKGIVDVQEHESWERLKIYAVPLIWFMGNGMEGLQTMPEEFQVKTEGIVIPLSCGGWQTRAPSGRGDRTKRSQHHQ